MDSPLSSSAKICPMFFSWSHESVTLRQPFFSPRLMARMRCEGRVRSGSRYSLYMRKVCAPSASSSSSVESSARCQSSLRSFWRRAAPSMTVSAAMSIAPARASSAVSTPFSASMKRPAYASAVPSFSACASRARASGSSPFSRATPARVRRFCLKGR